MASKRVMARPNGVKCCSTDVLIINVQISHYQVTLFNHICYYFSYRRRDLSAHEIFVQVFVPYIEDIAYRKRVCEGFLTG